MRHSGDAPPGADNSGSNPSGATVTETDRPALLSVTFALCPTKTMPVSAEGFAPQSNAEIAATGGDYKQSGYRDPDKGTPYRGLAWDMPRMRSGALSKGAHSGRADRRPPEVPAPSAEVEKVKRRNARKAEKAARLAAQPIEPLRRKAHGRRSGVLGLIDALEKAA